MDCSLPGSSVHGIFQARVLEWVAIPFSQGSSWPWDWTWVSCITGGFLTVSATREAPTMTQNFNQRTDDLKSIKNHQLMKSGYLVDRIMNKREKKDTWPGIFAVWKASMGRDFWLWIIPGTLKFLVWYEILETARNKETNREGSQ